MSKRNPQGEATMTETKTNHTFETEPCGRCGGSGHYSFNQIHGSMCYGCKGKGKKLTKAGQAAYDAWLAIARPEVGPDEIVPGMKLRIQGIGGGFVVCEVASIEDDTLNVGQGRK